MAKSFITANLVERWRKKAEEFRAEANDQNNGMHDETRLLCHVEANMLDACAQDLEDINV